MRRACKHGKTLRVGALLRSAAALAATLAAHAGPLHAATYAVTANPDMTFTPANLTLALDDSVTFSNSGGTHNVRADDEHFHCSVNCSTNNAPSPSLWSHTIAFNRVGTFGYYCEAHGNLTSGMRGSVSVVDDRVFSDGFEASAP